MAAMTAGKPDVFQLGSGAGTSLNRLIELIAEVACPGRRPDVRYEPFLAGEVRHNWTDVTKAREKLGWTPRTSLPDGLALTWSWFRDHALLQSPSRRSSRPLA